MCSSHFLKIRLRIILPIFASRPILLVGIPVLRANFLFVAVIPKNVFQLKPPLFVKLHLLLVFFQITIEREYKKENSKRRTKTAKPQKKDIPKCIKDSCNNHFKSLLSDKYIIFFLIDMLVTRTSKIKRQISF